MKKILIVEDEFANALLLIEILKKEGIQAIHIDKGALLKKTLEENKDIALILMDVKLPDANGYELTKQIKEKYPELIVIIQTAYAFSSDVEKAKEAGSDEYISKPINRDKLLSMINKYIEL